MKKIVINYRIISIIYIFIFIGLMVFYCGTTGAVAMGEWDDYSFPAISLIREGNFTIDSEDIAYGMELIPEWSESMKHIDFSLFNARNGEQMSWYFPTYSIACIPMIKLFQLLSLPISFAFSYTNLLILLVLLLAIVFTLKAGGRTKFALVCLLSANPIVFYLLWTSAEVFIYSMLGLAMLAWHNKWYKRAAVFVSIAGTLNPTIMCVGIVMIIEYFINIWMSRNPKDSVLILFTQNIKSVLSYGLCYIIGIIPMIYNFLNTGHINLTASVSDFTVDTESKFSRFIAYLFDLNYGLLPYFFVALIISFVFLIGAFFKKEWNYIKLYIAFVMNIGLFSIMTHINSGMSGIARYNAWVSVIMIFAVCLYWKNIVLKNITRIITQVALATGCILTTLIVFSYGPSLARNTSCIYWTPIATFFLDNIPSAYNPLYSTFNCRTNHKDGAYNYSEVTPIVYIGEDGYVRKILASEKNKEILSEQYVSLLSNETWINKQFDGLGEKEAYISIPKSKKVVKIYGYSLGEKIIFSKENFNANKYIAEGLSYAEDWGTWTEGNTFLLRFKSDTPKELLTFTISNYRVFNGCQEINIYVNGEQVYNGIAEGDTISFGFNNPGENQVVELQIEIPNAASPLSLGQNSDDRILGLGLTEIVID